MTHEFLLDFLYPIEPRLHKMFGVDALYIGEKIYLAAREKEDSYPEDNGIWIGTELVHHDSLKAEFPSLRHLSIGIKKWLLLPSDAEDFEESARAICELIKADDPRIGVLPKKKKKKKKPSA